MNTQQSSYCRRIVLSSLIVPAIAAYVLGSVTAAYAVEPKIEEDTAWYNAADWGVEGKGWSMVASVERMCAQIPPDGAKDFLLHEYKSLHAT